MKNPIHIAIIGSGIVGTATGKGLASAGHAVTFCDVSAERIRSLREEGFDACETAELADRNVDMAMVCVPTPTSNGRIDLRILRDAIATFAETSLRNAGKRVTVVIRSTVLPGTTENVVRPLLEERSGKKAGADFGLCANPEFLRAKSPEEDFLHPKGIVIGAIDAESADALREAYAPLGSVIHACTPGEAEMAKYCSNLFDACKIAFFNEMRTAADAARIDADRVYPMVKELSEACWNPNYGLRDMGPFDGMCFPKDTAAFLTWGRETLKLPMDILSALLTENDAMETYFGDGHQKAKAAIRRKNAARNGVRTTVVIPAYNEEKSIGRCLEHATTACAKGERIIVVDSESTDKTVEIASKFPGVEIVRFRRGGSVGGARNAGLAHVETEFIASIDADTLMSERWLRRAEAIMDKDPSLACVSGPYRYKDLPLWQQATYNALTFAWGFVKRAFSIAQITGGNCLYRAESLRAVGGFESSNMSDEEDLRLALRIGTVGRVRIDQRLALESSGRRYRAEGFFRLVWHHFRNVVLGNAMGDKAIKVKRMESYR